MLEIATASYRPRTGQNKTFIIHGLFAITLCCGEKPLPAIELLCRRYRKHRMDAWKVVAENTPKFRIFSSAAFVRQRQILASHQTDGQQKNSRLAPDSVR
jgi:hypothetical protein